MPLLFYIHQHRRRQIQHILECPRPRQLQQDSQQLGWLRFQQVSHPTQPA
jgi:hypothetical protein